MVSEGGEYGSKSSRQVRKIQSKRDQTPTPNGQRGIQREGNWWSGLGLEIDWEEFGERREKMGGGLQECNSVCNRQQTSNGRRNLGQHLFCLFI